MNYILRTKQGNLIVASAWVLFWLGGLVYTLLTHLK